MSASVWAVGFALGLACGPPRSEEDRTPELPDGTFGNTGGVDVACGGSALGCWSTRFGTQVADYPSGIAVDSSGAVYIVGSTHGGFDGFPGNDYTDAFVAKLCADGTRIWTKQFGAEFGDSAVAVAVDANDNIYVAAFASTYDDVDISLLRYAADGALVWAVDIPGGAAVAEAVAVGPDDRIFVAGRGDDDVVVAGFAPDGSSLWFTQFGTEDKDEPAALEVAADGSVHVAGETNGSFPGNEAAGGRDAFAAEVTAEGTLVWVRQLGTPADDVARALAIDSTGSVYVVGQVGFDGGLDGAASSGMRDVLVAKLADDGTTLWTAQFGTSADDEADAAFVDADDRLHVIGSMGTPLPGSAAEEGPQVFESVLDRDGIQSDLRPLEIDATSVSDLALHEGALFLTGPVGEEDAADIAVTRLCHP